MAVQTAAKASGLSSVLNSDKLDPKFAKFVVLHQGTPAGLAAFAEKSVSNEALIDQLLKDPQLMLEMLIADGAQSPRKGRNSFGPAQYGPAMKIFTSIQKVSSKAKSGLFRRLALAVSLEHAVPIKQGNPKAETSAAETIDPIKRYQHYEKAYIAGELDPIFKNLNVWEYRMVINGDEPDDTLTWGR